MSILAGSKDLLNNKVGYGDGKVIVGKSPIDTTIIDEDLFPVSASWYYTCYDNDKFIDIPIDYQCMISGNPTLTPKQIYQLNKNKKLPDAPYEFAYAYAITTWKA